MRKLFFLFFGIVLCAGELVPQDTSILKSSTDIPLPFNHFVDMVGAAKCDGSGHLYLRPTRKDKADPDSYLLAPIAQVTFDGKIIGTFRLKDAWQDGGAGRGVFVDGKGSVYEATIADGLYVVEFAKDGSIKSTTKLDTKTYVDPWHIAVFPSGRFLVSGESGKNLRTPYTAIFDTDGRLLKQINESEDEDARSKAEMGNVQFAHNDAQGNLFVRRGDVTVGSDGNAYLLHGTSPMIYVISPAGEVVRKIQIAHDSDLAFRAIKHFKDRLAVSLSTFGHTEVYVTNLDGSSLSRYHMESNPSDVLALACYNDRGFTFATVVAGREAYLRTVKP